MNILLPNFYLVLLAGTLLLGLVLIAAGIVLLFRLKNKLAGGLTTAAGAVFTLLPLSIMAALTVTRVIQ